MAVILAASSRIFTLQFLLAQKDNVLQPKADVTATEGEAVTLGCEYNTSQTTASLFWYKQDVNDRPRFILSRSTFSLEKTEDGVKNRFKSRLNSTLRSVPLTIEELQPSDSAVYYCALQPTVTGNTKTQDKNLYCANSSTSTRGSQIQSSFVGVK
uniref:Ig-like domain-containing protein n=1 Tax=Myripristis murdjan TaxID=586833 RepID=A0A667WLL5_9TELE